MTELLSTGFTRTRLDERLLALQEAMQAIFGIEINVDADSIDGQALGIFAESISNLDQLAEDVYHSFNPQSATGLALSRIVQLNGIRRLAGAYSTVTLRCTGTVDVLIPAGSLVKSAATSSVFETINDATVPIAGFVDVAARATAFGAIAAAIGTLTKIDTPIYGWLSVTNLAVAVLGSAEETDEALRLRRRASTLTPAQAVLDSIAGTLSNIVGVTQALVLENFTNVTDGNGLLPHSIYCVVNGGADQDIIDAIWRKKTVGADMKGAITGAALDTLGSPHTIKFSRPTAVPIYIKVTIDERVGLPTDATAQIKAALLAWFITNQTIGEELVQSRLFDPINTIPGHSITSVFISTAPAPTLPNDITIAIDAIVTLIDANIQVIIT